MKTARYQKGTSLLEILVAIVVMAIGLLGVASLQVNALKYQKTASQRAEAVQAAYDLGERMRANWGFTVPENYAAERAQNEANYRYVGTYASSISVTHQTKPYNCEIGLGTPTGCTAAQVAANDLQEWQRVLELRLVGGAGYIIPVTGQTSSTFDITIMWKEQGFTTVDATCPSAVAAPIGVRCFTLRYVV